ncbi:MAG: ATP-binding cassette domain-containing protein [Bdellovibrionales bacterium]|nr:ATP-binding cassette domain-containing protein [Bdellovibrionales bacterium]
MIKIENLVRYYGEFLAVNDVSFSIPKGQILGLLGHNGAGKTTIMKMITGYLEPSAGRVLIDGLSIESSLLEIQQKIGYLPEGTPLYSEMTVAHFLEYVCELRAVAPVDRPAAIRRAVAKTGLKDKALEAISTLSKGYKQRLGVAQAIIHKPEILILDEPTSGLDPSQIQEMRNLIKELSGESTIILSTHILQEVEAMCERVVIIKAGQLARDAMLSELQESHSLRVSTSEKASKVQDVLKGIDGIERIESLSNGQSPSDMRIVLNPEKGSNAAALVAKTVVSNGWDLFRLEREQRDLEAVFKEINRVE